MLVHVVVNSLLTAVDNLVSHALFRILSFIDKIQFLACLATFGCFYSVDVHLYQLSNLMLIVSDYCSSGCEVLGYIVSPFISEI